MASMATYSPEERARLDKQLEGMTTEQLEKLEAEGGRIIRKNYKLRQREYSKRFKQRIALQNQQSEGERR